ncbi:hypothetical protein AJ79_00141 [Helicocarpus griseus UAMH5409]|uniref:Protein artemis n=1 Tax=Helicocarpus griseus UAMH5409 TaxID=1447875 RepID=A0A2B7YER5_9EURO|nr:hypothetical protein AJ79_00141 [Helicocarpus griseus UAMH5409]
MSTFDGIVEVDYFRKNPDRPAPLACFLSHVHGDHIQGLESLRAPFIYCSAATREILLRLEKYPHRLNFSKGILETRKQHYKHLSKLLRPIPLQVPTEIELSPRNNVRVTLFDANHCPGAVMFLIEGNGRSILYTGDIRAEPWWVDGLVRNPILIPYTLGNRRLDKIYLDTTFATKSDVYQTFPSKAEGIRELLEKIKAYPESTIFYLRAWTFGYEDVWLALAAALNTQVHVDDYQMELYTSLATRATNGFGVYEAPFLCGFTLGHSKVPGCLTGDKKSRLHSCEPGMVCSTISKGPSVYITPIVSRTGDGSEVPELGVGGGKGDLYQNHELELPDDFVFQQLADICAERIEDEETRVSTLATLSEAYKSKSKSLPLDSYGIKEEDEISIQQLVSILSRGQSAENLSTQPNAPGFKKPTNLGNKPGSLSNTIHFPYSRHSSYAELCNLVRAFQPKDVFPCTVDHTTWSENVSMRTLFGHLCSGTYFSHDELMRDNVQNGEYRSRKRMRLGSDASSSRQSTQRTESSIFLNQENELPPIVLSTAINEKKIDSESSQALETEVQDNSRAGDAAITYQGASQDTSQETTISTNTHSSSINSKIVAIKRALKEKNLNQELEFAVTSSLSDVDNGNIHSSQKVSQSQPQSQSQNNNPSPVSALQQSRPEEDNARSPINDNNNSYGDDDNHCPFSSDSEYSLSLSSSAFDSQTPIPSNHTMIASTTNQPSQTAPTSSRMKARIAAFQAARSGNSEEWFSFHSPVSAGNNHTEEEVEL